MVPLIWGINKKVKYKEESRMVVVRGWGWEKIERCFNGYKLSVIK